MSDAEIALSVMDLVPVTSGSNAAAALRNAVDLAQRAEQFGYRRYWFAEHHLSPGIAGASPAVAMALIAGATSTIRLGAAGFQLGHRTALSVVEEVGMIDALHPGRVDVGLGRSRSSTSAGGSAGAVKSKGSGGEARPSANPSVQHGLVIPRSSPNGKMLSSPRFALQHSMLTQPGARTQIYSDQVGDVLALLAGSYSSDGVAGHATPGEGADVQVWVLGSSAGESAAAAAFHGLRFAANYHTAPAYILEAVAAYRQAFRPSAHLAEPYIIVSADVVVADDDDTARQLAAGYGVWVHSVRSGMGAIPFPSPQEVAAFTWTDEDRALVADRVDTQLVGSARTVACRLKQLVAATAADELVITTITHSHADRVRSYELLAKEWLA